MFNDRPKVPRQNLRPLYDTGCCDFGGLGLGTLRLRDYPLQSGTAFLAYTFGLRHAVDPDHIAAIDNVTRKLVREGKRLVAFGVFFSLGHSTIVWLGSVAMALTALAFKDQLELVKAIGGVVRTLIPAFFLLAIAVANSLTAGTLPGCGDPSASASALPPASTTLDAKKIEIVPLASYGDIFCSLPGIDVSKYRQGASAVSVGGQAGLVRCANRLSRLLCRHTERVWRYHDAHYGGHRFGRHPWAKTFVFTA
jgi:hypothetical protein